MTFQGVLGGYLKILIEKSQSSWIWTVLPAFKEKPVHPVSWPDTWTTPPPLNQKQSSSQV